MASGPKLELRQGQAQTLVMTAQLQQSIKLLQLSAMELESFVHEELEKNPLLSREEGGEEPAAEQPAQESPESQDSADTPEDWEQDAFETREGESYQEDRGEAAPAESENWQSYDSPYDRSMGSRSPSAPSGEFSGGVEHLAGRERSLRDHLLEQLQVDVASPALRMIGAHLIDLVDESGYITDDLSQLTELLGCTQEQVEETLALLQRFDPPGVCARTLSECLAAQLRERDRLDPAMQALLDHLDLLGKGDMASLQKFCGIDAEDLKEMCEEIRSLNPKPGLSFSGEMVQTVVPDVFVRRAQGGGWTVELNSETLPRVLVNRRYYSELTTKSRDKKERKYLSDQLNAAHWLVKALDQRAQTILKVATEIVAQQEGFLYHGVRYLKPLTLKDVAQAIGVHESTVSRVTSNKYMNTPRGLFEFKYFFTSSLQSSSGGGEISSRAVQEMIREMIEGETAQSILSDDAIADILKKKGIDVARRTVAKYREAMGIGSSVERRQKARFSNNSAI